jgi:hypothetical protein
MVIDNVKSEVTRTEHCDILCTYVTVFMGYIQPQGTLSR